MPKKLVTKSISQKTKAEKAFGIREKAMFNYWVGKQKHDTYDVGQLAKENSIDPVHVDVVLAKLNYPLVDQHIVDLKKMRESGLWDQDHLDYAGSYIAEKLSILMEPKEGEIDARMSDADWFHVCDIIPHLTKRQEKKLDAFCDSVNDGDLVDLEWPTYNDKVDDNAPRIRIDMLKPLLDTLWAADDPKRLKFSKSSLDSKWTFRNKILADQSARDAIDQAKLKKYEADAKASDAQAQASEAEAKASDAQAQASGAQLVLTKVETELKSTELERTLLLSKLASVQIGRTEFPPQAAGDIIESVMEGNIKVRTFPINRNDGSKLEIKTRMDPDNWYNGNSIADSFKKRIRDLLSLKPVGAFIDEYCLMNNIPPSDYVESGTLVKYVDGVPWFADILMNAIIWGEDPFSGNKYMSQILRAPSGGNIPQTQLVKAYDESTKRMSLLCGFPVAPLVKFSAESSMTDTWYNGIQLNGAAVVTIPFGSSETAIEILQTTDLYPTMDAVVNGWLASTHQYKGERSLLVYTFERSKGATSMKSAFGILHGKLKAVPGMEHQVEHHAYIISRDAVYEALESVMQGTIGIDGMNGMVIKWGV